MDASQEAPDERRDSSAESEEALDEIRLVSAERREALTV